MSNSSVSSNNGLVPVETIVVRGQEFEVQLHVRTGEFNALVRDVVDGKEKWLGAASLEALRKKIKEATGKVRWEIPVVVLSDTSWYEEKISYTRGYLRGIHSGNGNLLIDVNGRVSQHHSYESGLLIDPPKGLLERLLKAHEMARLAVGEYQKLAGECAVSKYSRKGWGGGSSDEELAKLAQKYAKKQKISKRIKQQGNGKGKRKRR